MCLAVPGEVITLRGDDPLMRLATVDFDGVQREISLACTPEAEVGDFVLAHAGFAFATLDRAAADRILAELAALGEAEPP